jgi:hypothetical protein
MNVLWANVSGYPSTERITMRVSLKDIREAFEFVCTGGGEKHQAFLCKQGQALLSFRAL